MRAEPGNDAQYPNPLKKEARLMADYKKPLVTARRLRAVLLLGIFFLLGAATGSWAATVKVENPLPMDDCSAGQTYPVRFRVQVAPPWFIHGAEPGEDGLISSQLSFPDSPLVRVTDVRFPPPEKQKFPYGKDPVLVLSGQFEVEARVVLAKDIPTGPMEIAGAFSYQACSATSCLPPESVPIKLSFTVIPPGPNHQPVPSPVLETTDRTPAKGPEREGETKAGLLLTLLGIFLGGLALNLTPCVYPLIPITVSYFGGKGQTSGKATLLQGLIYIFGLAVTNSVLGATAGLSGAMLGSILQNPIVLIAVALVLVGLATSFFGLWEIRLPVGLTRLASRNYSGYFGTFFMGLTLGIVAAPCLGPFILGLLTYVGQRGDPFLGLVYFFVLSIGLGLPLAVLAIFSGALKRLPLSGGWMTWVRKILGWVLVGMAGYLIQPLIHDPQAHRTLFAFIALAAGLHVGWLDRSAHRSPVFPKVKKGVGLVLMAGALALYALWPLPMEGVQWVPYSEGRLSKAARENKAVILDFYAEWCVPCRSMDRSVFTAPEVVRLSRHFLPLRVDVTQRHADQDRLLKLYGIRGVPSILFLDPGGMEQRDLRIESYVSADEMVKKMKQAADPASK